MKSTRLSVLSFVACSLVLGGCELLVDFDRSRIVDGGPDASMDAETDVADGGDTEDAADASDVADASDAVDAMDAMDAADAMDAMDAADAMDATISA